MTMIDGNGTMSKTKYHMPSQYGEMAEVLDAAFEHYLKADTLAEARSYRDDERNAEAEKRAMRYERLKAKALRMHQERPRGLFADVGDWREIAVMGVGA